MLFVKREDPYIISEIIRRVSGGEDGLFLSFETTYLKNIFFKEIKKYIPDTYIINCCSSDRRIKHDLLEAVGYNLIIYDFVDEVNNSDIINILNKQKIFIR